MKLLFFVIVILSIAQTVSGQGAWGIQGRYLTKSGKPVYLSGVNYILSDGWMINLPNLSRETANADMAALQNIGVNHIRFFPLWHLTQPTVSNVDEKVMEKLDLLVESAGEHNISMQIAPLTGWMSGAVFLPSWAVGDLFRDPKIIEGQKFLCKSIATRYQDSPEVLGYDFGNEINVLAERMTKDITRGQVSGWMKRVYSSFKDNSSGKLITNGIGTGYDIHFDVRDIAQTSDYLSPHSYPYFHGTSKLDPWYGQRTTYSPNFIISWCEMMRKPVVLQEIGCSEAWLPASKIGAYIRLNYFSIWADGAAGFIWWSSHNIDPDYRVKCKDMHLQYSNDCFSQGKFEEIEYRLGLLTTDNEPKEYAPVYSECIKTINELGLSWVDRLPVCYIVVPCNISFDAAMHKFITAYSLAKQAHFDVKLCYEGTPVPADASAVFVPGLKLSGEAKKVIEEYLTEGGLVYQSYENDFGSAITLGEDMLVDHPEMFVNESVGMMEYAMPMSVAAPIRFRKTSFAWPARPIVSVSSSNSQDMQSAKPGNVFFSQPVGKGTFFYFSGSLEAGLAETYNPWPQTNCELLYTALKAQTSVDIDNKYVELYIKQDGDRRILLLLNHSEQYQHVTVKSVDPLSLLNYETKEKIGTGKEITVLLKPAEVLIADIQ
ncbi:MAG: hypothetical protein AB2L20_00525 [Mangrovibacterium sp.]